MLCLLRLQLGGTASDSLSEAVGFSLDGAINATANPKPDKQVVEGLPVLADGQRTRALEKDPWL